MTDLEKWLHEVNRRLDKYWNTNSGNLRVHAPTDLMKAVRIIKRMLPTIKNDSSYGGEPTRFNVNRIALMSDEEVWK